MLKSWPLRVQFLIEAFEFGFGWLFGRNDTSAKCILSLLLPMMSLWICESGWRVWKFGSLEVWISPKCWLNYLRVSLIFVRKWFQLCENSVADDSF